MTAPLTTVPTTTAPPTTAPPETAPPDTTPAPLGQGADWSLTPDDSGPPGVHSFTAYGYGCLDNGSGAGLSWRITKYDENGVAWSSDGGQVLQDGTWHARDSIGKVNPPPGRYKFGADCLSSTYTVLFSYPDKYLTVT